MALHAYFDGSSMALPGQSWETGSWITLAGFATKDSIWKEFTDTWRSLLLPTATRPGTPYLHMREAAKLIGPFNYRNGWNQKKLGILVTELLMYVQTLPKDRFRQFGCTIDLQAYRTLQSGGCRLPSPIEICNNFCPFTVMAWYFSQYPGIVSDIHYYFDSDEPFEPAFRERWQREKSNQLSPGGLDYFWSLVQSVDGAEMRHNPPLQLADLLAWGTNRYHSNTADALFKHVEPVMKQIIPSSWIVFDAATLSRHFSK